jgi:hypothetical protein
MAMGFRGSQEPEAIALVVQVEAVSWEKVTEAAAEPVTAAKEDIVAQE